MSCSVAAERQKVDSELLDRVRSALAWELDPAEAYAMTVRAIVVPMAILRFPFTCSREPNWCCNPRLATSTPWNASR